MADLERMKQALKNADAAGDTAAATAIAKALKAQMAGQQPAPQPETQASGETPGVMQKVDDFVRGVASGMTFGLADELAAAATTATGMGGQPGGGTTYEQNLAAERERDRSASPYVRIPGELAGAVATGIGAGKAGLTLLNAAKPTVGSMALRGAGEGAAYGALHGFGNAEDGLQKRLEGAGYGGALGAVTGAATGAVAGKMAQPKVKAPAVDALKAEANAAYKAAEDAGVVVTKNSFDDAVDKIVTDTVNSGIDKTIHPKATAALNRLIESKGGERSLKDLDLLRRVIRSAATSNEPDERRLANLMVDKLDDYITGLKPSDVAAGDTPAALKALSTARGLWSRARKGEIIDNVIERAKTRASQFSGSGYENALRTEFRSLAMNAKRMRPFSPNEQAAIKKVAEGGPIENALRFLGKFAPHGIVSSTLGGGAGYALGGPLGSVAVMGGGEAARRAATAMTSANANAASALARSGGLLSSAPALPAMSQRALDALIAAEGQQMSTIPPRLGVNTGR